jgi:hypothetical protein
MDLYCIFLGTEASQVSILNRVFGRPRVDPSQTRFTLL